MKSTVLLLLLGSAILVSGASPLIQALGSPFPNARVIEREERKGCGFRYKLRTNASSDDIAAFYKAQAEEAHLGVTADQRSESSAFRMILYGEKGPGRVLSVMIDSDKSARTARIYFVPRRTPSCG